jgi:predicted Rossmann fold nucleotide-binding protein DprA/Smf involved in DNA uptake
MMMNENNQAILLLTARFGPSRGEAPTPLGPTEYGRLAAWLHEHDREPRNLFRHPEEALADWPDSRGKITVDRVKALLNRGVAMGVALEKWQGAGLWILTRADADYPKRLRKQLGTNAPAILFGAGNQSLLNVGGLAMVGSRDITEADQKYARQIAEQAAHEGINVVSGGAKGVDEVAMKSALEVEGTALGILANGLLKAALSSKWRTYLKKKQLCLVSSFSPEAGFNVGNAMSRNRYIYCLSDFALVVQSAKGKGGTWAGATENLKHHWVPLLYVQSADTSSGLRALARLGATPLEMPHDPSEEKWLTKHLQKPLMPALTLADDSRGERQPYYSLFVEQIKSSLTKKARITLKELKESSPDLTQTQIVDWLDRAVKDGILERRGKRRVYTLKENADTQGRLL